MEFDFTMFNICNIFESLNTSGHILNELASSVIKKFYTADSGQTILFSSAAVCEGQRIIECTTKKVRSETALSGSRPVTMALPWSTHLLPQISSLGSLVLAKFLESCLEKTLMTMPSDELKKHITLNIGQSDSLRIRIRD